MSNEVWYFFGVAAILLIALRIRGSGEMLRNPMALVFTLCLFLPAFGTLSKQPFIADFIDKLLGVNSAWLVADILFISGVTCGTYWIEMLGQPELQQQRWHLFLRWRVVALVSVAAWMVIAAGLRWEIWSGLERGGIDVAGSPLLLSGRMAYFGFSLWSLTFLSYGFYCQRRGMTNRTTYIRMTLPWVAISLAVGAPFLQAVGAVMVFTQPDLLTSVWATVWLMVTVIQAMVAVLILATFISRAYGFVIWLDKQFLVHRLHRIYSKIYRVRPDLLEDTPALGQARFVVRDVDRWLTTLVSEIEMVKIVLSGSGSMKEIQVPAGGSMPELAGKILKVEQEQLVQALTASESMATHRVRGDFYALARWYVSVI